MDNRFSIGFHGRLGMIDVTFFYGVSSEVEDELNPLWISKRELGHFAMIDYYESEELMMEDLKYQREIWRDNERVRFIQVNSRRILDEKII